MEPTFHLEGIIRSKEDMEDFEGPLNLILMLLSKNKIAIEDIKISEILDQYLEQLAQMESLDLEMASGFVQMASHLLYIKTKMLLSTQEEVSELQLLMEALSSLKARDVYSSIKQVTEVFAEKTEQGILLCTKMPEPIKGVAQYKYRHEPHELLSALLNAVTRGKVAPEEDADETELRRRIVPQKIVYNVQEKGRQIMRTLIEKASVKLSELYEKSQSRSEIVATFISTLELCSMGNLRLSMADGEIVLKYVAGSEDSIKINNEQDFANNGE